MHEKVRNMATMEVSISIILVSMISEMCREVITKRQNPSKLADVLRMCLDVLLAMLGLCYGYKLGKRNTFFRFASFRFVRFSFILMVFSTRAETRRRSLSSLEFYTPCPLLSRYICLAFGGILLLRGAEVSATFRLAPCPMPLYALCSLPYALCPLLSATQ